MPVDALTEADLARLQDLLDALPEHLEPLDVSMVDGYLCGVLLQPEAVPIAAWLPPLLDAESRFQGRADDELVALLRRRHRELNHAIAARQWFDPWVFELDAEDGGEAEPSETVLPWVAGFAHAMECHPALMRFPEDALLEPLAALYMHLDPDDLEDADELLEEIESLEPPADLDEAVEGLVSAVLMLADVSRPLRPGSAPGSGSGGGRPGPGGSGRPRAGAGPRRGTRPPAKR